MQDSKVSLGKIVGAHGIRGAVKLLFFTQKPEDIFAFSEIFLGENIKPCQAKLLFIKENVVVMKLEGCDSRNDAELLKGLEIWTMRSSLPDPEEDSYYYSDLAGCKALYEDGVEIGVVRAVCNLGAGDLLEIETLEGDITWPFNDNFVKEVDLASRAIILYPMIVI